MDSTEPLLPQPPNLQTFPSYTSLRHQKRFGSELEPRRWWILLAFSLYNAGVAFGWLSFGVTPLTTIQYFGNISQNQLLLFADSNLYMCFFLSYLGCWCAHKIFKKSLLICFFIMALAGWIRYFGGSSYQWALIGQFMLGIAAAPSFGFSTLLPDRWFPANERFLVTSLAVNANYFGWILACIFPALIVGKDPTNMPLSLLIQAIFMTLPIFIGIFAIRDKPKVPPSYSALVKLTDTLGFFQEMRVLSSYKGFIWSSLFFGLTAGISFSVTTASGIFMEAENLTYLQQGIIQASYAISGMVTGILGSIFLSNRERKNYDLIIKILMTGSLLSLITLGIVFYYISSPNMLILVICNSILGIGLIGFVPFVCGSIIESTFPVQESMSTNAISMVGMASGILVGHLSTIQSVGKGGFLVLGAFMLPCWIYAVFIHRTVYKQQVADECHEEITENLEQSLAEIDEIGMVTLSRKPSLFEEELEPRRSEKPSIIVEEEEDEELERDVRDESVF